MVMLETRARLTFLQFFFLLPWHLFLPDYILKGHDLIFAGFGGPIELFAKSRSSAVTSGGHQVEVTLDQNLGSLVWRRAQLG